MIVAIAALAVGVGIGYLLGSPKTIEAEVEKHIETPEMSVKGSVHSRGEASVDSIEAENVRVLGSVHGDGTVYAEE